MHPIGYQLALQFAELVFMRGMVGLYLAVYGLFSSVTCINRKGISPSVVVVAKAPSEPEIGFRSEHQAAQPKRFEFDFFLLKSERLPEKVGW